MRGNGESAAADASAIFPLGVCVLDEPVQNLPRTVQYPDYIHEILGHSGLCYSSLDASALPVALDRLRVLVTVGEVELPEETVTALRSWLERGGVWIAVGGVCGHPELFGVEVEPPAWSVHPMRIGTLGEGYLLPVERAHKALEHLEIPLRLFNGVPVRAAGARVLAGVLDAHQRQTDRAALTANQVGDGECILLAPDLTGAVVRIQQGVAITRDGVPAPDGTACIADLTLKTDDGAVLDWLFDREPVTDASGSRDIAARGASADGFSAFLQPVADQWRELLVRLILDASARHSVTLPVLWLYPRGLPALGHVSHDTDICEPENAMRMLEVISSAGLRDTWCVILPGYPSEVIDAIRSGGHELAVHFDAMPGGCAWIADEFAETVSNLSAMFGGEKPVTNKNHYLRWEGDTEFFDWCAANGIQIDQSKGPSKSGNVGFTFGTCHPYFPVSPDGRLIDVLELPTLTQDLIVTAPAELGPSLARAARRCHGVMHLLFHPSHILKPGVEEALANTVAEARSLGMEFWTARQINDWERARRSVTWSDWSQENGRSRIRLRPGRELRQATVMWLSQKAAGAIVNGAEQETELLECWGHSFSSITLDIEPGAEHAIEALHQQH